MADCPGTRLISKSTVNGGLRLESVRFVYPGTSRLVLHDIDLEVEPGETIALVGSERIGQDHALQPDRPVLRPNLWQNRA